VLRVLEVPSATTVIKQATLAVNAHNRKRRRATHAGLKGMFISKGQRVY